MKIPGYVSTKMSLYEKIRLFLLRRRAAQAMKRMDYYIKKSHAYQDAMYATDDALVDFIQKLSIKYV
jgi:flagellum-specific peptidoglycan hydrolase FlgJ